MCSCTVTAVHTHIQVCTSTRMWISGHIIRVVGHHMSNNRELTYFYFRGMFVWNDLWYRNGDRWRLQKYGCVVTIHGGLLRIIDVKSIVELSWLLLPSHSPSWIAKPSLTGYLKMVRDGRIKPWERRNDVYSNSCHVTEIDTARVNSNLIRSLSISLPPLDSLLFVAKSPRQNPPV